MRVSPVSVHANAGDVCLPQTGWNSCKGTFSVERRPMVDETPRLFLVWRASSNLLTPLGVVSLEKMGQPTT